MKFFKALSPLLLLFVIVVKLSAQNTLIYTDQSTHFRNGIEFFERQNYSAARQEFSRYIEQTKQSSSSQNDYNTITAEYYSTICALYLDYPEAEVQAQRFVVAYPEHPKAGVLFRELGLYYFNKQDYNKAVSFLEKADTRRMTAEEASDTRFKLGIAYYNLQNLNKALEVFNGIKQYNDTNGQTASYYAGQINFRNENYEDALEDFRRIEKTAAYQAEVPGLIAQTLYRQKKYEEALVYAEGMLKDKRSGKKLDELALIAAEISFQQNKYDQAVQYFNQYNNYKGSRMSGQVAYRYGYSLYRTKDFKKAADILKNVASNKDTLGQFASYYLGISYLKNDNPNFALNAFDQARKAKFSKTVQEDAAFQHAKVQLDANKGADAIRELNDFLKLYPDSRYENEANELLSEAYLSSNNYLAAIEYIEGLKRRTPKINAAYQRMAYNQGVNEYNAERFEQAIKYFDKAISTNENRDLKLNASFWKAEALAGNKQLDESLNLHNQLLKSTEVSTVLDEIKLDSRYAVGYIHFERKQYTEAASQFKLYTDKLRNASEKRNFEDAIARLADCYYVSKNYSEAQKLYDFLAAQGKGEKDYALFQKGLMLANQDQIPAAKSSFDQVVSKYPNSRYADDALFQLGMLELNSGNYQIAVRQFTRLIQEKNRSSLLPSAYLRRALAYSNLQQNNEAIQDYKIILDKYPNSKSAEGALKGLQEALNAAGRSDEFNESVAKYKKANPGNESVESIEFESAKSVYYSQKYDKAIQALLNYMQNYPGSSNNYEARYLLADSYFRQNDKANALRYYYLVIDDNQSNYIVRAATRAAEIEASSKNFTRAIRNYRLLLAAAGNSKKDQLTAWTGLMENYYQTTKQDSTIYFAREIINAGSVNLGAQNKALLFAGKAFLAKGDTQKATEELTKAVNAAKDENGAEAKYLLAELQYKAKKYKESQALCYEFSEQFSDYGKWLDKTFLLLSDTFIATNDFFQARATLNSIIENSPNSDTIEAAKAKLKSIEGK